MRRLAPVTLMIVVWLVAALPALAGGAIPDVALLVGPPDVIEGVYLGDAGFFQGPHHPGAHHEITDIEPGLVPLYRQHPPREPATEAHSGIGESEGESLADMLTVALVVSVTAMVWVGWSRGPEKRKKEVLG
jgi:hypothetical protein